MTTPMSNALLWLAEIGLRKHENEKAIDYVKRAAKNAPPQLNGQLRLAQLQSALKLAPEAQRTLEQALERNPESTDAMRMLMSAYFETGRTVQAEALLPKLEAKAANDPKLGELVKTLRGRLMVAKGAGKDAESILREQADKNPDDLGVLRDLARSMDQQGRSADAQHLLSEYAQKHADVPQGWLTLGEFFLTRKDESGVRDASRALTRALLLDPENSTALRDMIQISLRRQNPVEVLALCNRYLAAHPSDADILFTKSKIQAQSVGTLAQALDTVNEALASRKEPEFITLRGLISVGLGKFQQAVDDLQPLANTQRESSGQLEAALAEAYLGIEGRQIGAAALRSSGLKRPKRAR